MYPQALIIPVILTVSLCSDNKGAKQEEFVASDEWQEITEGQKVPAGLHYRINLSTGKKEAKILDNQEEPNSITNFITEQTLKDLDKPKNNKFRTIDEIKRDLGDLLVQPKSDLKVLKELFESYEQGNNTETVLKDLQYLGHQIDNAQEFCNLNGFKKIIYKELNSSIKGEALKLFSVLAQNNPKVKVHILETGGVAVLLKLLSLDPNEVVKNSALTALSCTLRTFPYAQNKFIEGGGLTVLTNLFGTASLKLQVKIVTFLTDLITERQQDIENFEQHQLIDVESALVRLGWCENMNLMLQDLDLDDFDSVEKVLLGMKGLSGKCQGFYDKDVLERVRRWFQLLIDGREEDDAEYLGYLVKLVSELIGNKDRVKSEL
ncbi:nucleotide exchange factor SIL1 [Anthonomus grandis grandis]|uniref:nucleotide exchange factor SIL1 n=1 Tax=Anthonomus grandis grandis TaxID=2921223 RepID=UPI0021664D5F|nr:nucleotide exchange factor SIL1 [Anthonomus grandis grandis]